MSLLKCLILRNKFNKGLNIALTFSNRSATMSKLIEKVLPISNMPVAIKKEWHQILLNLISNARCNLDARIIQKQRS
jgi:hypothetical protein